MSAPHTADVLRAFARMSFVRSQMKLGRANGLDFYDAREAYFAAIATSYRREGRMNTIPIKSIGCDGGCENGAPCECSHSFIPRSPAPRIKRCSVPITFAGHARRAPLWRRALRWVANLF